MLKHTFYSFILILLSIIQCCQSIPLSLADISDTLDVLSNGKGTYYNPGLGSCGIESCDTDLVVAVNYIQMDNGANPNKNPKCGQKIKIRGLLGLFVTATIIDTMPTGTKGDIDMSPALFKKVCGSLALGLCKISWEIIDDGGSKKSKKHDDDDDDDNEDERDEVV